MPEKASALVMSIHFQKPFTYADFDPKVLKRNYRKIGQKVVKLSRKNVSVRRISKTEEYPGLSTGLLKRSINYRVSKSGFSVGVADYMTAGLKSKGAFYPAFVYWGHRAPGADRNTLRNPDKEQQHKKRIGAKVAGPRKNWIVEAANQYGNEQYLNDMAETLDEALKPGVIGK